jgi:flagellar L-ring protein precursor FlgH
VTARLPRRTAAPLAALLAPPALLGAQPAPATPPATPAATPATAATAAAAAPGAPQAAPAPRRASWTSDRREFVVGDIITILIDDYTISTAVKENLNTDNRTRGLSASATLPGQSQRAGIDSRNSADQMQRGQARRENRFQNEMSVRVVAVGPGGLLQVKGEKVITVDKAAQDVAFAGWIRAQDVGTGNTIESSRVADAQLSYSSPGGLGKPKQGLVTKLLGALWP